MAVAVDQGDELRAAVYGFTRNREALRAMSAIIKCGETD